MQPLREGETLRLDGRRPVRITCLFGVLWVTRAHDPVDHFLRRGESLDLNHGRATLIAGFTASVVSVKSICRQSALHRTGSGLVALLMSLGMRRAPAGHPSHRVLRVASG